MHSTAACAYQTAICSRSQTTCGRFTASLDRVFCTRCGRQRQLQRASKVAWATLAGEAALGRAGVLSRGPRAATALCLEAHACV